MNWHQLDITSVYEMTGSASSGISSEAAEKKIKAVGYNQLPPGKKRPAWVLFLLGFKDMMILILVVAAIIAGISGEVTDMIVIVSIVVLNGVIGFVQQYNAGKAMEALKKLDIIKATVIRDRKARIVSSVELVPGDLVFLEAGSTVPADLRLTEASALRISEAALTGESLPAEKSTAICSSNGTALGDRFNMAYKGTAVVNGRGAGIVVGTGQNTEMGHVSTLLSASEPSTPLQVRMTDFSKKLSYILLALCLVLFITGLAQGEPPMNMLLLAISLAVAAIPEALPALITIALAMGAKKLVRKNILVRKLSAVETLGSVSVICTDKTGTLTENRMQVTKMLPQNDQLLFVDQIPLMPLLMALNHDLVAGETSFKGDPMELALVDYAAQQVSFPVTGIINRFPRVAELPFDPLRRCMTTIHRFGEKYLLVTKGAAETIVSILKTGTCSRKILSDTDRMAADGMRVIAYAYSLLDTLPAHINNGIEQELVFGGLAGMIDPARKEIITAISRCLSAGVMTVMITGDHPATAIAIARQTGIMKDGDLALSGTDLDKLTESELDENVEKVKVYARVSPEQKLAIVQSLQRKNHYVAMTGDGVNDAPSLKMANIGIAMGITGTDISKEAAQMILLDDNFGSIVKGIQEGRRIYDNIRKFIKYILTCNSAEMAVIFIAPLVDLPIPLLPIQLLWINLVTDGLPGLALSAEKADADIMQRPPRKVGENLFAGGTGVHIIWAGLLLTTLVLILQGAAVRYQDPHWQTMVFTALSFSQLAHVFAVRSENQFVFSKGVFSNRFLATVLTGTAILQIIVIYLPAANKLFRTQQLTAAELLCSLGIAVIFFHIVEFEKWIRMRREKIALVNKG